MTSKRIVICSFVLFIMTTACAFVAHMDMMNNIHGDLSPELLGAEIKFVTMFEKMANGSFTALIGALAYYMGQSREAGEKS